MSNIIQDPTKAAMLETLRDPRHAIWEFSELAIEAGIYWYATQHHGGQSTNLYSASSTSEYTPSRLCKGIEEECDDIVEVFSILCDTYGTCE